MPGESLNVLLERVNSEESLLVFIAALIKDRRQAVAAERENPNSRYGPDAGGWENRTIEEFLEAAAAWAESTNFGLTQGLAADNLSKRFAVFLYWEKSTNDGNPWKTRSMSVVGIYRQSSSQ